MKLLQAGIVSVGWSAVITRLCLECVLGLNTLPTEDLRIPEAILFLKLNRSSLLLEKPVLNEPAGLQYER